jgi:hypothetical protein
MQIKIALASAVLVAAIAVPMLASAAPFGGVVEISRAAPQHDFVEVRHGRWTCIRGRTGWHYHNVKGERIACPPRPRSAFASWRCTRFQCGWYHRGQKKFF